ncbi:MAG: tRNA (adenosine(37)-N6)-dimethylallyltransferase MiaA [Synergistales bacterium]|nr:tRNA (adenosine(37)-N6)-dimethylallyltransferase MiaA [Synergistales bacterium]
MKEMTRIPVISIIGPTAVGKTKLSLDLAEELDAEIISVDSRQVYRYLDIGTDKVSIEERREVIHHLIDIADPDEIFTVMDFIERAKEAAERIVKRGKRVLFAGGTPFYYKSLFDGTIHSDLPSDPEVRSLIEERLLRRGKEGLYDELKKIDPVTASRLHPNDSRRVVRSLEIFELTGKIASWWYDKENQPSSCFNNLYIGLERPRPQLYERISERVREQFNKGYVEEVRWLLDNSFSEKNPSMQGFGYREIIEYLKGSISLEDAILSDIRATKTFSRRQMTWFRKFSPIMWYDTSVVSPGDLHVQVISMCKAHYEEASA